MQSRKYACCSLRALASLSEYIAAAAAACVARTRRRTSGFWCESPSRMMFPVTDGHMISPRTASSAKFWSRLLTDRARSRRSTRPVSEPPLATNPNASGTLEACAVPRGGFPMLPASMTLLALSSCGRSSSFSLARPRACARASTPSRCMRSTSRSRSSTRLSSCTRAWCAPRIPQSCVSSRSSRWSANNSSLVKKSAASTPTARSQTGSG